MLAAFDPSTTRFGYAFGAKDDLAPKSGVWPLFGAADPDIDRTLGAAYTSVATLLKMIHATHAVIEAPWEYSDRGKTTGHIIATLNAMSGAVSAACHNAGCRIIKPQRSTVLKQFCARAIRRDEDKKLAVLEQCAALRWITDGDDNRADACALWAFGLNYFFSRAVHPLLNREKVWS